MKPLGGTAWAPSQRPHRMRATYHHTQGLEYFLGFSDVYADCFAGRFAKRKRVLELTPPSASCGPAIPTAGVCPPRQPPARP